MLIVFAETYEPGPAPIEWNGSLGRGLHVSADGGVAIMSAWILRDEFCARSFDRQIALLLDATPIKGRTALGARGPDSSRFEFIEDGFGALAHELGHALGLPHDTRRPEDLMGNGFRSLQVNYRTDRIGQRRITFSRDNARLLAVSRYLMRDIDLTDDEPPTAAIQLAPDPKSPRELTVKVTAKDNRELKAVIYRDLQRDTVIGGADLTGKRSSHRFILKLAGGNRTFRLQARVADAGGNFADVSAGEP
jgi:hypothetical protein